MDRLIRYEALDADPDTWAAWKAAGWTPPDDGYDFMSIFGMDAYSPAWFGSHLHPGFYPAFEVKVLEDDGRRQLVQTEAGGTKERFTDGRMSIPRFVRFAVETLDDLTALMPRLDPGTHARVDEQRGHARKLLHGGHEPKIEIPVFAPLEIGEPRIDLKDGQPPGIEPQIDGAQVVHGLE